jgi:hypothetical protein
MTKKIDELNDIVVERDQKIVDQTVLINLETWLSRKRKLSN